MPLSFILLFDSPCLQLCHLFFLFFRHSEQNLNKLLSDVLEERDGG